MEFINPQVMEAIKQWLMTPVGDSPLTYGMLLLAFIILIILVIEIEK